MASSSVSPVFRSWIVDCAVWRCAHVRPVSMNGFQLSALTLQAPRWGSGPRGARRGFERTSACQVGWTWAVWRASPPDGDCAGQMAQVTLGHLGLPDSQSWFFIRLQLWIETSQPLGTLGIRSVLHSHQGAVIFVGLFSPPHESVSSGAF